jgi:hypothetical protein
MILAGEFADALVAWLRRVSATETPPSSVIAFNIGLFETDGGFMAYLVGAEHFDPENADWASDESFTPRDRYVLLPAQRGELTWQTVLVLAGDAARGFIASPEGVSTFLGKARAVTVGFDDGDLVRVK